MQGKHGKNKLSLSLHEHEMKTNKVQYRHDGSHAERVIRPTGKKINWA